MLKSQQRIIHAILSGDILNFKSICTSKVFFGFKNLDLNFLPFRSTLLCSIVGGVISRVLDIFLDFHKVKGW